MKIGKYKILETIGTGGFFKVYKAFQVPLNRVVLLKEASCELPENILERFKKEGKICANLNQPNIVTIYDSFQKENKLYHVFEYIEGFDLSKLLEMQNKIPPQISAYIILNCLNALKYAHTRGVIHRDIKPSNILISREGHIKISDFGIARETDTAHITQPGTVIGTPYYMSPEQARGEEITESTDLFSLGVVLYESLTGEKPFTGKDTTSILLKIEKEKIDFSKRVIHKVPPKLKKILKKALEKNIRKRYKKAEEMKKDIEKFLGPKFLSKSQEIFKKYINDTIALSDTRTKIEMQRGALKTKKIIKTTLWTGAFLFFIILFLLSVYKVVALRIFGSISFKIDAKGSPPSVYVENIGTIGNRLEFRLNEIPPGIYRFRIENKEIAVFYDVDLQRREKEEIELKLLRKGFLSFEGKGEISINGEKVESLPIRIEENLPYLIKVQRKDTILFQTFFKTDRKKCILIKIESLPCLYPTKAKFFSYLRFFYLKLKNKFIPLI